MMRPFILWHLICLVILVQAEKHEANIPAEPEEILSESEDPFEAEEELLSGASCDGPGSDPFEKFAFDGRCNCKKNVRGKFCDKCKPNTFNLDYEHRQGCLRCFCSGKSKNCDQSNWFRESMTLSFDGDSQGVNLVFKNLSHVIAAPSVSEDGSGIYVDNLPLHSNQTYYWKLPEAFLGDKLTSYGGYINYTINYDVHPTSEGKTEWLKNPLVFIQGNGETLFYRFRKRNRKTTTNYLQLVGSNWYKLSPKTEEREERKVGKRRIEDERGGKPKKRKRVKRKELMEVLSNIDFILIKANYRELTRRVGLLKVSMSYAVPNSTTKDPATSVEKCECPEGYGGLSCQYCSTGFSRNMMELGIIGGGVVSPPLPCTPCQCNGKSDVCHPETGVCENCQQNTTGTHCEESLLHCDKRGTLKLKSDARHCKCKARVSGELCDACKRGHFHLDSENEKGCKKCWCSGVTFKCASSQLRRFQVKTQTQPYINIYYFNRGYNEWSHRPVELMSGRATFTKKYSTLSSLYWSLPKIFTGHLLKSYGGNLYFSVFNEGLPSCPDQSVLHPFLELESFSGVRLWWKFKPVLRMKRFATFSVKLTEEHFVFYNSTVESSRNIFLEVLTSVKTIKVRVPECSQMTTEIGNIILDTAMEGAFVAENPLALEVESCECPFEYAGLSCEFCALGYTKDPDTRRCIRKSSRWS